MTGTAPTEVAPLAIGQRFESGWVVLEPDDLEKFWTGTRLDRAYGSYDDSYVPGFYLVALLDPLAHGLFNGRSNMEAALNYGFDRLRFTRMVRPLDEVRLVCTVASIEARATGTLFALDCALDLRSGEPALVARWLFLSTN